MSCCCDMQSGLGALGRVYGLRGLAGVDQGNLNKYVVAGSVIEWGGYLERTAATQTGGTTTYYVKGDEAQRLVKPGLWNHGGFSWVDVGQIAGVVRPYISIVVTTRVDFGKLQDVLSVIEGAAWNVGLRPELVNFGVRSIPSNALVQNTPNGLMTPSGAPVAVPDQQNRNPNNDDDDDDDNSFSGAFDKLATMLGVDRTTAMVDRKSVV